MDSVDSQGCQQKSNNQCDIENKQNTCFGASCDPTLPVQVLTFNHCGHHVQILKPIQKLNLNGPNRLHYFF
ncbi:unnamed protein product [Ceutorhynchus assimilis]|uniref:Uncharacterized protein n=1 Tax=Ceutorhynchus assimilis TaxID=467358 RepID=A0A9N9MP54_9CUCU|nr:unnamed protein product [Ceutorhynchus assimilis]